MIFLHEIHEVAGGRMPEFEEGFRGVWKPAIESGQAARLLWFWEHAHGTGPSYQAVSVTAVRDWPAWGEIVGRTRDDPTLRAWLRDVGRLRREVISRILLPTRWSPLQEVDLAAPPEAPADEPGVYLHDTGWPYPGHLDGYVEALGSVYVPALRRSEMITIEACWTTAPGTGRFHEVVLLQKVRGWDAFSRLLTRGEERGRAHPWMTEGLKHRDRWESKLLRTVAWSPRG